MARHAPVQASFGLTGHCIHLARDGSMRACAITPGRCRNTATDPALADGRVLAVNEEIAEMVRVAGCSARAPLPTARLG